MYTYDKRSWRKGGQHSPLETSPSHSGEPAGTEAHAYLWEIIRPGHASLTDKVHAVRRQFYKLQFIVLNATTKFLIGSEQRGVRGWVMDDRIHLLFPSQVKLFGNCLDIWSGDRCYQSPNIIWDILKVWQKSVGGVAEKMQVTVEQRGSLCTSPGVEGWPLVKQ